MSCNYFNANTWDAPLLYSKSTFFNMYCTIAKTDEKIFTAAFETC